MQAGSTIHHFLVKRVRELPEIKARLWELEHEKNGAELVWLERADENKTFSIAFKTIPEDDTGVFHILEHSVLCGSDKYPVKEPFVELLKSSVQTFLNAITFPDKTVYPVSSRNDKDFLNLVSVYLDAVLHPAIVHKPEIFRQEGWRYELREGEEPIYQGVVLNEMKGSMASPYSILYNEISSLLFPDNCYRFVSGGDPAHIPDLSYEQFMAAHRTYYHPSNARISLVGSVDLDAALALIDSYLNDYERLAVDFAIPLQKPVARAVRERSYEIGAEEPEEERYILAGAALCGRFDEQKKNFAAKVLADYLAGDNEAPLKRAILDAGLGQDVQVSLDDGLQQSVVTWAVWNTGRDRLPEIRRSIRETVERLASEGLDRERLEACVNRFAFQLRDRDGGWAPRSLSEGLGMLDAWLYGGDPALPLLVDENLAALSCDMDSGYFEALLRELMLNDESGAELLLVPSKTLGEERRAKEAARLKTESAAWTPERCDELKRQMEALTLWQQSADSPEALASIPMLKLSDLNEKPEPLPVRREDAAGVPVLRHELDSGVAYARLHFAASDLSLEELPCLSLLCELLSKLPTEHFGSAALQTRIKQKLGKLSFTANPQPTGDPATARVYLSVAASFLEENGGDARELIGEILNHTLFADTKILSDVVKQSAMNGQMSLSARGNLYGSFRAAAQLTASGAAREAMSGFSYIAWTKARGGDGQDALEKLLERLGGIAARVFRRERLTLSLSANAGDALLWSDIVPQSGKGAPGPAAYATLSPRQEGILIPADIGFAAKAGNTGLYGASFSGSIPVLANILNFDYLWNEIRVQGGAYGCGFDGREDGELFFYTYRDPQPARSLGIFDGAADFIRGLCASRPDLTRYILGSVAEIDPLRNAEQKMGMAERLYFRGKTQEELDRYYEELLHTSHEDLLALCELLRALADDRRVCVVAGQAQIDACGERLDEVQKL